MDIPPLLSIDDARVQRDGRTILHVDRLTLAEGEHVALLGPNGSGKSTLIKLLTRDVLPLAADPAPVLLRGQERWDLFEARKLFGVVSGDLQDDYDRPVRVRDVVMSGYFSSIGLYRPAEVTDAMRERVAMLMEALGVTRLADALMPTLSTGEARRALIARALVADPPMLVLDEPGNGLDPHAMYHFLRTVSGLAGSGRGLLLVTHHIEDIVPQIDRVIMLKDGHVLADGPKAEMLTSERLSTLFDIPAQVEQRDGVYRLW